MDKENTVSNGNNAINTMSAAQVATILGQAEAQQDRISMTLGNDAIKLYAAFVKMLEKEAEEVHDLENTQMHTAKVMSYVTVIASLCGVFCMGMMNVSASYEENNIVNSILNAASKTGMIVSGIASALPDAVKAPYTAKIGEEQAEVAQTQAAVTEAMNVLKERAKIQKDALDTASSIGASLGSLINNTMYAEMMNIV